MQRTQQFSALKRCLPVFVRSRLSLTSMYRGSTEQAPISESKNWNWKLASEFQFSFFVKIENWCPILISFFFGIENWNLMLNFNFRLFRKLKIEVHFRFSVFWKNGWHLSTRILEFPPRMVLRHFLIILSHFKTFSCKYIYFVVDDVVFEIKLNKDKTNSMIQ